MGHGFFGFSPSDAARRSNIFTNLHRRESCLTVNKIWVFHPGGGSTPSCYAQTHLYLFHLVSNRLTHLDFVPFPESLNQYHTQFLTHNRVPVTPNPVPIHTMHSQPCHAMSSCTCFAIMLVAYTYSPMHTYSCILSVLHI